ncbi:MAG: non-hydrolyzing UDP-N-acetylglucosamine 2-epimerase [Armatimonadota bacterium]
MATQPRIVTVFGTRPDAIKMAPVVLELKKYEPKIKVDVVVTGQHREMLDQVLDVFHITPEYDLKIMQHGQSLSQITARVLTGLEPIFDELKPDVVFAQGDTSTTFVAGLAAFYHKAKFAHVEAGLRTHNKYNPFPEEMNRVLTAPLAEYHFAPTSMAKENLLREAVDPKRIWITGNTGIDALLSVAAMQHEFEQPELEALRHTGLRTVLLTSHRRENWGEPLTDICRAVLQLVDMHTDIQVVFPMHRNPIVRKTVEAMLGQKERITLTEPPDYKPFVKLQQLAELILTDSGGVQEEAPSLGKPVLVLRETTERQEGVTAGTALLVGTDTEMIISEATSLLTNKQHYHQMANATNPYGDGTAAQQICQIVLKEYGIESVA